MNKKAKQRRRLAKLRSCMADGRPWFVMPSALSAIGEAFESRDLRTVESAMRFGREVDSTTKVVNGIAVIPVVGILRDEVDWLVRYGYASSYQLIEKEFKQAIANPNIKGVIFYVDSPGGSAIGCKRVADAVFAARGKKPVRSYTQGMCGSAAFYIASACDQNDATADSMNGSVGTIYKHHEYSGHFKDFGVGVTVFANADSPKKKHGNDHEPLSAESRKTLQEFVDSYGKGFIADVAKYKGIDTATVIANFGQGDAYRGDEAINRGMIDTVVADFSVSLQAISGVSSETDPVTDYNDDETPVVTGLADNPKELDMKVGKKVRAQLFANGLIAAMDVSDELCIAAIGAWCVGRGVESPDVANEGATLTVLQAAAPTATAVADPVDPAPGNTSTDPKPNNVQEAHDSEVAEARLADLRASAKMINGMAGREIVTATMIMDSCEAKETPEAAMKSWTDKLSNEEPVVPTDRITPTSEGADRFAEDAIDAMVYRSCDNPDMELSDGAASMLSMPLWAVAGRALELSGHKVDMYGARELLAEEAMQMGNATRRETFFSSAEDRRYVQASGIPASRPGDFPNILSGLANKFLDMIELDEDYAFSQVSALLPGGLNDFKPALMVNKGIVEELDELKDAGKLEELGLSEEVLSYLFLRRFGNSFGWTPVMIANDDMNAFAEGMIGLRAAWMTTQNRLVIDRFTSNENLLDGSPLFADRANTGAGTNPAQNNNKRTGGGAPSDAEWGEMETLYSDIGGVGTGKRVRGTINTAFCPTGKRMQEARRTFMPLNQLEPKAATDTANVGLYRGDVAVIGESELRIASATKWYGLRSPTRLNTATIVRAYFNGYGTAGRRERWYDPTNKTTYVSLEGRIAVAVKNWRYAISNEE